MSDVLTNAIEAVVGACCLAAAVGAWRLPGLRWVAGVLAVAGLAALVHAAVQLV